MQISFRRTSVFILLSSLALILLLLIQVNWILKAAEMREQLFNEKANMVLSKTVEALYEDEQTFFEVNSCIQADCSPTPTIGIGERESKKIDSLFNHYMRFYNLDMHFSYVLVKPENITVNKAGYNALYFNRQLDQLSGSNQAVLKLILPQRSEFIKAELGPLFFTSVLLVIGIMFFLYQTTRSLIKEKLVAEQTTDFINNMTHELKTPLTNISLAGRMMNKDVTDPEKLKRYSGIIGNEAEKLNNQVEHVLSITALDRGEVPLKKATVDVHKLIAECIASYNMQVENRNGSINFIPEAGLYKVNADATHLCNAIGNVIENALKYSGVKPEVLVETFSTQNYISICISDKGNGIDSSQHEKIFGKFYRVPSGDVHDVKGFGLGLTYTKKIIELHDGNIRVESSKGKGAKFIITLPHE